ncbi:transcription regulator HTH, apses-type DNA-binding domain-containing protein [Phycomyces blakesleeanus]|uniref:Transcription regulator HTH, apses-type DNA-binding domain-containing protein n=1 Tax=Phycomyces blakesleeanus TaxID=4837 RepID=A0ABR3AN41_PHYBL
MDQVSSPSLSWSQTSRTVIPSNFPPTPTPTITTTNTNTIKTDSESETTIANATISNSVSVYSPTINKSSNNNNTTNNNNNNNNNNHSTAISTLINDPAHLDHALSQDSIVPIAPNVPNHRNKLATSLWEDEATLCYQVDARGICVARRQDNDMVNGTKLLNVTGMSRGKRDGILKNEKSRVVVKVGAMHLKGVWVTFSRAKFLAEQHNIAHELHPLFVDDPGLYFFRNSLPLPPVPNYYLASESSNDYISQDMYSHTHYNSKHKIYMLKK